MVFSATLTAASSCLSINQSVLILNDGDEMQACQNSVEIGNHAIYLPLT